MTNVVKDFCLGFFCFLQRHTNVLGLSVVMFVENYFIV